MASAELLDPGELRRRVRGIAAATRHLLKTLEPESPHNVVLRVLDIARYSGVDLRRLRELVKDEPPARCSRKCGSVERCRLKPRCRGFTESQHRALSHFFLAWDTGDLLKARVGKDWKIVSRHNVDAPLAKMAAASLPPSSAPPREIAMKIDLTTLGPRLRMR